MSETGLSRVVIFMLATSCGLIVANLYYAQPLVGLIQKQLSIAPQSAGLIVTMTQIGYALGLLLIVPLADLIENRRLINSCLLVATLALLVAGSVGQVLAFFSAALFIGLGSVAVQVMVPYAAHLARAEERGQVVGQVMSGLLLGIMLARPWSSLVTHYLGWQWVFWISAGLMLVVAAVLQRYLPSRYPADRLGYAALLGSMARLVMQTPVLRHRAFYHACLFGAFSLFWTTIPLRLSEHFGFNQMGIALFALVGVTGALAAPIAGRLADRGYTIKGTQVAMLLGSACFVVILLTGLLPQWSLSGLFLAGILLDLAVSAHLVFSQRVIFSLDAALRGRLNGLFMATFFVGGAIGSALGGWLYAQYGWTVTVLAGLAMLLIAWGRFYWHQHQD